MSEDIIVGAKKFIKVDHQHCYICSDEVDTFVKLMAWQLRPKPMDPNPDSTYPELFNTLTLCEACTVKVKIALSYQGGRLC